MLAYADIYQILINTILYPSILFDVIKWTQLEILLFTNSKMLVTPLISRR